MIPLSVPNISGNEWKYVKECLDTSWVSSVGKYVDLFEERIREFTGSGYAVATMNGTSALHISLQLSGVGVNDSVLVPNITFIASANSITYSGATPIFVDVDTNTWQIDLKLLENYLEENVDKILENGVQTKGGKNIKAIMPVHILGGLVDVDHLLNIAKKYNLAIVEDSTEALGSVYKNKHAGTFGQFGCFSFNGNKILTTGGGGMIVTDDKELAHKAKHITTQAKSDPIEYIHDEIGYNYRLVNVLAALGVAQMECLDKFIISKSETAKFYQENLKELDILFQESVTGSVTNNWMQTINVGNKKASLLRHLVEHEIQSRPLWVPMNQLEMFKTHEYISYEDVSHKLYNSCLSLPCSTNITQVERDKVVETIQRFYSGK